MSHICHPKQRRRAKSKFGIVYRLNYITQCASDYIHNVQVICTSISNGIENNFCISYDFIFVININNKWTLDKKKNWKISVHISRNLS